VLGASAIVISQRRRPPADVRFHSYKQISTTSVAMSVRRQKLDMLAPARNWTSLQASIGGELFAAS